MQFICRSRDQNLRFILALFLLQEKLHSHKRVHVFHPALASRCCEHFVFYSRRWVVLWLGCFHLFLCYSPHLTVIVSTGTHLLSGGIESVLVQWQYGAGNRKAFLPRLGGSILHISASSDGQLFCTSHSDNSKSLALWSI